MDFLVNVHLTLLPSRSQPCRHKPKIHPIIAAVLSALSSCAVIGCHTSESAGTSCPSGFTGSASSLKADLLALVNKLHIWGQKCGTLTQKRSRGVVSASRSNWENADLYS